jgi:hypothetical protein
MTARPFRAAGEPLPVKPPKMPLPPSANCPPRRKPKPAGGGAAS